MATDDPRDVFRQTFSSEFPQVRPIDAGLYEAHLKQREQMEEFSRVIEESNAQKAREQKKRDDQQTELVELQRSMKRQQEERDKADAVKDASERKRRRHEIYRWCFTTALAIAALTVAIISLSKR